MLFSLPMLKNIQMLLLYCFRKSLRQKCRVIYEPGNSYTKLTLFGLKIFSIRLVS